MGNPETVQDRQSGTGDGAARLPDPSLKTGPFTPFRSDPGWSEAWWWLGIPAVYAAFLIGAGLMAPEWYSARLLPEGYGFIELAQFFTAVVGFVLAVRLLFRPAVRRRRTVLALAVFAAVSCFYIAGEEHSWGQHFFNWQTPEYWAEINRQQETNLHNVSHHLDKKPRLLLEFGVWIGGLIVPALALFYPWVRRNRWSLFLPAAAMAPAALGSATFKLMDDLHQHLSVPIPVVRPSEPNEAFLYIFIVFYLVVFTRRIGELERENGD